MSHFSAMKARAFGFREACQHAVCCGLISLRETSVNRGSSPRQVHQHLYVVVVWARCCGGIAHLLPRGLLGVLLIRVLIPVVRLEVVLRLVECVLGAVVWDPSSGPYSFDHLSSFSVLYGLGFVLVVVFGEWRGDDC